MNNVEPSFGSLVGNWRGIFPLFFTMVSHLMRLSHDLLDRLRSPSVGMDAVPSSAAEFHLHDGLSQALGHVPVVGILGWHRQPAGRQVGRTPTEVRAHEAQPPSDARMLDGLLIRHGGRQIQGRPRCECCYAKSPPIEQMRPVCRLRVAPGIGNQSRQRVEPTLVDPCPGVLGNRVAVDLEPVFRFDVPRRHFDPRSQHPLPLREADLEDANRYIADVVRRDARVSGFILSDPRDTKRTVAMFREAEKAGVRFRGVKPYYDLLGKSNFDTGMGEFVPRGVLEFMNAERLILMLHTAGMGMCDPANRDFVRGIADDFPHVTVILAHMGRYVKPEDFLPFWSSDVLDRPSVFLEMSSVTEESVYSLVLAREDVRGRVLFGSDVPYGLITGVERWSEEGGALFATRDRYHWSEEAQSGRTDLTYNTYHSIHALKRVMEEMGLPSEECEELKQKIFCGNARALLDARR